MTDHQIPDEWVDAYATACNRAYRSSDGPVAEIRTGLAAVAPFIEAAERRRIDQALRAAAERLEARGKDGGHRIELRRTDYALASGLRLALIKLAELGAGPHDPMTAPLTGVEVRPARPTDRCHECRRIVPVSSDNRLHSHYDEDLATCPGSGTPL